MIARALLDRELLGVANLGLQDFSNKVASLTDLGKSQKANFEFLLQAGNGIRALGEQIENAKSRRVCQSLADAHLPFVQSGIAVEKTRFPVLGWMCALP